MTCAAYDIETQDHLPRSSDPVPPMGCDSPALGFLLYNLPGMERDDQITLLLQKAAGGDQASLEELMRVVYADLERLAKARLRDRFGHPGEGLTLEPKALVHETFVRLIDRSYSFENRRQYFALASKVMLNVLNDYHRKQYASKRGGDAVRVTLSGIASMQQGPPAAAVIDLSDALERLAELNPRHAEVVELRCLWGFTVQDVAQITGDSVATVERLWRFARTWLAEELESGA